MLLAAARHHRRDGRRPRRRAGRRRGSNRAVGLIAQRVRRRRARRLDRPRPTAAPDTTVTGDQRTPTSAPDGHRPGTARQRQRRPARCRRSGSGVADDGDGDGPTDGEELALGSDPTKADTDGDGTSRTARSSRTGTDPTQGVLPLTRGDALKPWGVCWDDARSGGATSRDKILDEVNPGGWEGFLFGNPHWGVTLDETGELEAPVRSRRPG